MKAPPRLAARPAARIAKTPRPESADSFRRERDVIESRLAAKNLEFDDVPDLAQQMRAAKVHARNARFTEATDTLQGASRLLAAAVVDDELLSRKLLRFNRLWDRAKRRAARKTGERHAERIGEAFATDNRGSTNRALQRGLNALRRASSGRT